MKNYRQENKAELMRIKYARKEGAVSVKPQLSPEQEKRNFIIKLVAFLLALILAVVAFSTFAKQCTAVAAGWQVVSPNMDKEAVLYSSGVSLNYNFEGTANERRAESVEVRNAYSKALAHIYKLLDPENRYEGYYNLAYVNAHRGEEVKVSPELYAVLQSALELTEAGEANIFGGALYYEWRSITALTDSAEFDPLVNPDERQRIEELARMTADLNNFGLELTGGDTVRFTVSDDYLAMLTRLEINAGVLDTCFLREAYELEYAAKALENEGHRRGFITTVGGMTYCMSEAEGGFIVGYSPVGGAVKDAFKVPMTAGLMCCCLRSYSYGADDIEYYTVETPEGQRLRHPHYALDTGEVNDALLTVMTTAEDGDFAALCARCCGFICSGTAEQAEAALAGLEDGMHAAFITKAEPMKVNADKGFEQLIIYKDLSLN